MAKWGKGESGNPSGRPKLPEEAKELRKLTAEQITTVFSKYLGMTMSEMSAVKREELSLLELWIIKAAETGMRAGNYLMLDKMLDRIIGKTFMGAKLGAKFHGTKPETESNSVSEERLKEILNILNNPQKVDDIKDLSKGKT